MAFQNFFATKAFTDIGSSDTTITLETPPTALSGRLVLEARNATQREIIKYTGVSGNQITGVTRGQGGTTAKSHLKNSLVEMNATSEDLQDLYDAFGTFSAVNNDWRLLVPTITSVTNNSQRSYDVTFNSTVAAILSAGMRLRTTRTVAAPTQSASLNGTTQYFSKTTPAGMTFTDDFAVGAWVKLSSYPTVDAHIISRYNGTSGWQLYVSSSGQISLVGRNGSSANYSLSLSYQSLPLNKWVHVAAQLDMSAFTATTTTSYMMFDGVDVPTLVGRSGTNPTALVQAGNLEIGSTNGGTFPFSGKIAQPFVTSAKVTQATVRGYMSQGLLGTETSLVSAYSLSNSVTDLNVANANNLTANGGVVATNADSPFGGQANGTISSTLDYAIVEVVNGAVVTIQVPEGCTIPTSGGISAVSYSTASKPYGFPDVSPLAYSIVNANQNPATVETNIFGLTATIDPLGTKNIRVTAECGYDVSTTDTTITMSIKAGSTYLASRQIPSAAGGYRYGRVEFEGKLPAGSTTFQVVFARNSGTGLVTPTAYVASAGAPSTAFLKIEAPYR